MKRIEHFSNQVKVKYKKLMVRQQALKLIWVFLALSSYTNFMEVSIGVLRTFSGWKEKAHNFS